MSLKKRDPLNVRRETIRELGEGRLEAAGAQDTTTIIPSLQFNSCYIVRPLTGEACFTLGPICY